MLGILWNLFMFVIVLGVIVFIHELGHFTWSKICGVYVYEFALGMGPKLFGFKKGETEYSLRLIPIGGFCSLAGEDLEYDESVKIPKEKQLNNKTKWQRFLILFFGPGNNFILSLVLLLFIGLVWGGNTMNPVVTAVNEDYPAEEAGITIGDNIKSINGYKVKTSDDVSLFLTIAGHDKATKIVVEKENGTKKTYEITPKKVKEKDKTNYYFGISLQQEKTYGFVNAIKYMWNKFWSLMKQMVYTVRFLVTGKVSLNQLSGPVGIYSVVGEQSRAGLASILFLIAYLSINVGFLNLVPLPAFDGGHIFFIVLEAIRGKKLSPEIENKIHSIGLALLMFLMLIVTINDIIKLF